MYKQIAALINDTNKNEELAIKLVQRSVLRLFIAKAIRDYLFPSIAKGLFRLLIYRRISRPTTQKDFLTHILAHRARFEADSDQKHNHKVSDIEVAAHVSDFVLAGSDTTSTVLSTATYYLLKNPTVYRKLASEIRYTFKSSDEINEKATCDLVYLNAICKEAMRIYAPIPLGLPRQVPRGGETVDGHFIPAGVCPFCVRRRSLHVQFNYFAP